MVKWNAVRAHEVKREIRLLQCIHFHRQQAVYDIRYLFSRRLFTRKHGVSYYSTFVRRNLEAYMASQCQALVRIRLVFWYSSRFRSGPGEGSWSSWEFDRDLNLTRIQLQIRIRPSYMQLKVNFVTIIRIYIIIYSISFEMIQRKLFNFFCSFIF